jgi:glyoxylase-like metal-dependent hydrolase (beta-lactamase superfamily II)
MLEINEMGDVIQIKMSRELDGKPLYWVSAYLVDGILIDTGCHYTAEELASFLNRKKLHTVVNTHFHEDHTGGNHLIKSGFPVNIFAHPESIPLIMKPPKLFPYQEFVWGFPEPTEAKPVQDVIKTDHFIFEVIETPGHSEGHIVLLERTQGWCFSGDLFARENPKFIRPEEHMGKTVESMKKIAGLKTDRLILFTSIGRRIEDGRQALLSCTHYLEELSKKAKKLESKGLNHLEIIRKLFGGEHPFAQMTNGQYTTENLIRSVLLMD